MTTTRAKSARLDRGLSQRELATKARVSRTTVQNIEAGAGAHPASAKRIADVLEITVTQLLGLDAERAA